MVGKTCLLAVMYALLVMNPGNANKPHRCRLWSTIIYDKPSLMWDRKDSTSYANSTIVLYYGEKVKPGGFSLILNKPLEFLNVDFDSSGTKITRCWFQIGTWYNGPKNMQWTGSVLREFLSDSLNINGLPAKVSNALKSSYLYLEAFTPTGYP